MQEGEDFPYVFQDGFSKEFLMVENSLIERDEKGNPCQGKDGKACLECTCGSIISGKVPKENCTKGGSVWTNDSAPFLEIPPEQDFRTNPRNTCVHFGYASIALIPIRTKDSIVGLIHLNDRRKGLFAPEIIEHLETIGSHIGSAIMRKQAEEELREALKFNEQIISNAQEGIVVYGPDFRYKVWNPYMEILTGFTSEEVLGRHPLDRFPFLKEAGVMARLEKVMVGEFVGETEFPWNVPKTGRSGWATNSLSPLRDHEGKIIGVIEMVRDTTERKRVDEAVTESKALLESVVENVPLMIFLKDARDLRFAMFNRAGEELLGYDRQGLLGKNDLDFFPPEQASHFMAKDREVIDANAGILDIPEESIMTANGERWLHTQKVCIQGAEGMPKFLLGISEDITERKKAAQEKKNLQDQLFHSEKLASIGTIAAGVAHEINNPLAIIKGTVGNLARRITSVDDGKRIKTINHAIDRVVSIVNGLRAYARVDTDRMEAIDINKVIIDTIPLVNDIVRSAGITICQNLDPDVPHVRGNIGKIQQVIINLLNNASDALKERPTDRQINIETLHPDGETVTLRISDNGPGIPAAILGKILDPFFTTKEVGKGTGLGLSISSSIIESFGGTFSVSSVYGEGASFHITLPRMEVKPVSLELVDGTKQEPMCLRGDILVIDDEPALCALLQDHLEEAGLTVTSMSSPLEALRQLDQKRFDLVISDMQMPELSGIGLIKKARQIDIQARTKFIILTGGIPSSYSQDDQNFLRESIHGHLLKPWEQEGLLELVGNLLQTTSKMADASPKEVADTGVPQTLMVKRRSILVVDDEPEICQVVFDDLMNGGDFSVTIAADGQGALNLLQESSFDLVITDIVMPILDGIGLIRRARELDLHKTTKFIVMAGGNLVDRAKNEDDLDLLFNKIDGFLQKPFGHAQLFELIDSLLSSPMKKAA